MIRTPSGTAAVGRAGAAALAPGADGAELHLVVRVGPERFAFPVTGVDEAIDAPRISWVPQARAGLLGELHYRDRTVSAYDAGWAFGVPRITEGGTALILRDGDARVAVVVDDVEDLHLVTQESLRPVPAGADANGLLRAVRFLTASGSGLLALVRVEALLARIGRRGAAAGGIAP